MQEARDTVQILQGQADSAVIEADRCRTKRRESKCLLEDALIEMEDLRHNMAFTSAAALGHAQNKAVHQLSSMILSRDNAPILPPKVQKITRSSSVPEAGELFEIARLQEKVKHLEKSHTTNYIETLLRLQDSYYQLLQLCSKIPPDQELLELREDVEINKEETDRHIEEISGQGMAENEELLGKLLPKAEKSKISRLKV